MFEKDGDVANEGRTAFIYPRVYIRRFEKGISVG
jgi:hypothetical protein